MVWTCETDWGMEPSLDPGNYTFTLNFSVPALEESYFVEYMAYWGSHYSSNDMVYGIYTIENTSDEYYHFDLAHVEVDEYLCGMTIEVHAAFIENFSDFSDTGDTGEFSYFGRNYFNFNLPCEQPPPPIRLHYQDENGTMVEWSKTILCWSRL